MPILTLILTLTRFCNSPHSHPTPIRHLADPLVAALLTWCVVDADETTSFRYRLIFYSTRRGDGGEVFTHHLPRQHLTPVSDAGDVLLLPERSRVEETRRREEGGRCWRGGACAIYSNHVLYIVTMCYI